MTKLNSCVAAGALVLAGVCGMTGAASAQSLFVRGDVGATATEDYGSAAAYGGGVGLMLPLGLRADATLTYRGAEGEFADAIAGLSDTPGADLALNSPALKSLSGFVGGYWDMPEPFPFLEPFVGGGVGMTRFEPDAIVVSDSTVTGSSVSVSQDASTNPSYFVTAGVAVDFFKKVAIDLSYRYVNLGEVEYSGAGTLTVPGVGSYSYDVGSLSEELIAHEALISLRLSL